MENERYSRIIAGVLQARRDQSSPSQKTALEKAYVRCLTYETLHPGAKDLPPQVRIQLTKLKFGQKFADPDIDNLLKPSGNQVQSPR